MKDTRRVFIACDGSQAEARIMGALMKDEDLMHIFEIGEDIHAYTASLMFDKPIDEVRKGTKERDKYGKKLRHAGHYDMSFYTVADELKCSIKEARAKIERFHEVTPRLRGFYFKHIQNIARTIGYLENCFGHRYKIIGRTYGPSAQATFRSLYSGIPQGTIGQLVGLALAESFDDFIEDDPEWETAVQVHDEGVLISPVYRARELAIRFRPYMEKELMIDAIDKSETYPVTIPAEFKVGFNWGPKDKEGKNPPGMRDWNPEEDDVYKILEGA